MYDEGKHPLYLYCSEEKQLVRRQLGLNEKLLQASISTVIEWFLKQPHLVPAGIIDQRLVERMLLMAKGSVEKTKHRIDNLYKYRGMLPELMQKRVMKLETPPGQLWNNFLFAPLPKLYEGRRLTVIQPCLSEDTSRFSMEAIFQVACMVGDIRIRYDYMAGDIWIMDFQNFTLSHLLRLNPVTLRNGALLLQDGYGIRIKAIHAYNNCFGASKVRQALDYLRQFFKSKMIDRLIIHDKPEDVLKYVPKQYLPNDFGGDQPSVKYLDCALQKEFNKIETKEFLLRKCNMVSDESKRPGKKIEEDFLQGSFRTLDID